jgi:hypothetical protein
MTNKNFLTFASVAAFLYALGFVLMPAQLLSTYNVTLNEAGIIIARLFGAALLGFGVLNWAARSFGESETRAVLTANLVSDLVGLIFTLTGQISGAAGVNSLGWSTVVVYLILTAGFAYLRFMGAGSTAASPQMR